VPDEDMTESAKALSWKLIPATVVMAFADIKLSVRRPIPINILDFIVVTALVYYEEKSQRLSFHLSTAKFDEVQDVII
jgi:hypothetical protein